MNKSQLIDAIASEAKLTKADAKRAVDAFVESMTSGLKEGEKITLVGFGSWSVNERAARKGRNPQTGQVIDIAAKKVVKFKAGKGLSEDVN